MSNFRKMMLIIAALLTVAVGVSLIAVFTTDSVSIPVNELGHVLEELNPDSIILESEFGDPYAVAEVRYEDGNIIAKGLSRGRVYAWDGHSLYFPLTVLPGGIVYEADTMSFNGWQTVRAAVLAFVVLSFLTGLFFTLRQLKQNLYEDRSPLMVTVTLILFCAAIGQLFALSGSTLESSLIKISGLTRIISFFSLPVMLILTLALCASNAVLLRKEGFGLKNMLAGAVGVCFCIGLFAALNIADFAGSEEEYRRHEALMALITGILAWWELRLWGIIACAYTAAKKKPAGSFDYILILGCRIARNGGLTRLLQGRVDAALRFRDEQKKRAEGKAPVLIPCGGKGADEVRSEAEAMREYLVQNGVPGDEIILEDKSVNTIQNMKNAVKLMKPGARAAFATTNYHVFRSGVWARGAGLEAEGISSGTRLYYWPNAFAREYIALIASRLVRETAATAAFSLTAAVLAYLII